MNDEGIKWSIDDLKGFAASLCVQFYQYYTEVEAAEKCPLVWKAWVIGHEIEEAQMMSQRFED